MRSNVWQTLFLYSQLDVRYSIYLANKITRWTFDISPFDVWNTLFYLLMYYFITWRKDIKYTCQSVIRPSVISRYILYMDVWLLVHLVQIHRGVKMTSSSNTLGVKMPIHLQSNIFWHLYFQYFCDNDQINFKNAVFKRWRASFTTLGKKQIKYW